MRTMALLTCCAFVATLMAPAIAAAQDGSLGPKVDWGSEYIKVRGLGSFAGAPSSRKLIIAREKAILRAQRDMLGVIKELNIDSNTTMKETMESEEYTELINRQIQGKLKGAQVLAEGQLNKDTYEVILGVKLEDVRKAALCPKDPDKPVSDENPVIIPSRNFLDMQGQGTTKLNYLEPPAPVVPQPDQPPVPVVVEPVQPPAPAAVEPVAHGKVTKVVTDDSPVAVPQQPVSDDELDEKLYAGATTVTPPAAETPKPVAPVAPVAAEPVAPPAPGTITSLIVDARRLDADRAFWPRLLAEGEEVIYGNYDASQDFLQDMGAVAYAKTLEEAKECDRAGANPLIVKANGVFGKYKADLVVDPATADQIKAAEAKYGFMKQYKVIFILK